MARGRKGVFLGGLAQLVGLAPGAFFSGVEKQKQEFTALP
jgi:hypothetical protein